MPLCPNCGMEMEPGFLGTERIFSDVSWFKEKTMFGTGGESLDIKDKMGMIYIEGFRCPSCKRLLLKY
jgi:Domain of unknown function (DUF6487)